MDGDVHQLLLDAEGGDRGEARGLDAAHVAVEDGVAAPLLDARRVPGVDAHGVGEEQVGDDLELRRAAIEQRLAGRLYPYRLPQWVR